MQQTAYSNRHLTRYCNIHKSEVLERVQCRLFRQLEVEHKHVFNGERYKRIEVVVCPGLLFSEPCAALFLS